MRLAAVVFLILLLIPAGAFAEPLETAEAAFKSGDYQTALKIWQPLAEQGNVEAQARIGGIYVYGDGVKQNIKIGEKWIRTSANQGYWDAQNTLAEMYFHGLGVGQCFEEAYFWDLLAKQSNSSGLPIIPWSGADYYLNSEQKADVENRVTGWYLEASKHGLMLAQLALARIYLNGNYVRMNYEEAYFWGLLAKRSAANMEIEGPHRMLSLIVNASAKHLTSEQKSVIEKRVAEWRPAPEQPAAQVGATDKAETK